MSSRFGCVINRLVILWGSLSKSWYVMATHGESKEDSLHPSIDRDDQGVVRQQAVRGEQPEVLFLRLDLRQLIEQVTVGEWDVECPHRVPLGHRYEYHLLILQHGGDGIAVGSCAPLAGNARRASGASPRSTRR